MRSIGSTVCFAVCHSACVCAFGCYCIIGYIQVIITGYTGQVLLFISGSCEFDMVNANGRPHLNFDLKH